MLSQSNFIYESKKNTFPQQQQQQKKNTADRFSLKKRTYNTTPAHNNITRVRCSLCALYISVIDYDEKVH